ncbi:translation elongation factor Ts (EF-Ts) [Desulfobotulus alkaliphilus]|uniref:Elongation factor Ts n=1 Tax=Desulfobotulus alkaliphilus TaxID=622671 RepID=A0A562S7Y7_9BACT|nr:translation elongation factor Ts [Desulfobotulus alkaliphilus]TWI77428.1 translation elongation factor Ts (EF-Ts) [Desulfobotulus alkaliphilus]
MAEISAEMVKELRGKTGAGIMDCKAALKENDGDLEKAVDYLRKKGLATAKKKAGREASEGRVEAYIHMGGKIGVLVEVGCETDFVAKNEDFIDFCRSIAMHIAASAPMGLAAEDIPADVIARERDVYRGQLLEEGKPENMVDKIVEGKINKFYKDACLLSQPYIKDPKLTVQDILNETVGKIGENIVIKRFSRFQIGA